MLRLLHPFMPFISEEIWQALRPYIDEPDLAPHLAIAKFPDARRRDRALAATKPPRWSDCIEATEAINSLRSLLGYHPGQRVEARIKFLGGDDAAAEFHAEFERWKPYAATMAKTASLGLAGPSDNTPGGMVSAVLGWCEVAVDGARGIRLREVRAARCARSSTK